jgi:hypothetical protein
LYGQTWNELGTTPPPRAWQMLRSLRHDPPGWARKGERKVTFGAALEQAEQLFSAARLVTPAAGPILLFYGLSQAGRAVAAAAAGRENANRWRLNGHGITNGPTDQLTPNTLSSLILENQGSGAFTQLADILRAASLPAPLRLGDLWCLLPESTGFPLPGMGGARPINVQLAPYGIADAYKLPASVGVPSHLLSSSEAAADPSGLAALWNQKRSAVEGFLLRFPSLRGFEFTTPPGQPIDVRGLGGDVTEIRIQWKKAPDLGNGEALLRHLAAPRSRIP